MISTLGINMFLEQLWQRCSNYQGYISTDLVLLLIVLVYVLLLHGHSTISESGQNAEDLIVCLTKWFNSRARMTKMWPQSSRFMAKLSSGPEHAVRASA